MEASGQPGHGAGPTPPADYETVFTNAKAGMEGVDKEHVKKVVYEMSKVGLRPAWGVFNHSSLQSV